MQFELFNEPQSRKRFDRLIFMLFPNNTVATYILELVRKFVRDHQADAVLQQLGRQHISMHHSGDFPHLREKQVFAACRAAEGIRMPPFVVSLDAIGSFEGAAVAGGRSRRHPLVMLARGDGLFELFDRLDDAARRNGLLRNNHFAPHLTVSYAVQQIPFEMLNPIKFIARELVLIHSEVGLARYNVLGRWPLRG